MYAAKAGNNSIIRSLLRTRRANPGAVDESGRHAISWAAAQREHQVLETLLAWRRTTTTHADNHADVADVDGWTPLSWAMDMPGYAQNVALLLQLGRVDANHRARSGRSALSFAAGYGHLEITKILALTVGVDPDLAFH